MKGDISKLMKQAQQMQADLQRAQQEIADLAVTGESGAGMVKVTMTGGHGVKRVQLDPALLTEDKEMIEDLVAAAVNDAVRRVEEASKEKLSGLATELNLPTGLKLPF